MILNINHLRAALHSFRHYEHELTSTRELVAGEFLGVKSGAEHNPAVMAALRGCPERGIIRAGVVEGLEMMTMLDAKGPEAMLRCVTTPKDAPYNTAESFAALIQRWDLDLQMALDFALYPAWPAWVVIECIAPYVAWFHNPTELNIISGKRKLAQAIATIKAGPSTSLDPIPVHVPLWREKQLAEQPNNE